MADAELATDQIEELARELLDRAVLRGRFTLRSGATSDYYIDKYRFGTDPVLLRRLVRALAPLVPTGTDRLAGTVLGAVPLAVALSLETGLPSVFVRPEVKGHGTARRIEGLLERGERVTLVEDVLTTGGAALAALDALREAGAEPLGLLCVVDRQEGGTEALKRAGVPLRTLFTSAGLGLGQGA